MNNTAEISGPKQDFTHPSHSLPSQLSLAWLGLAWLGQARLGWLWGRVGGVTGRVSIFFLSLSISLDFFLLFFPTGSILIISRLGCNKQNINYKISSLVASYIGLGNERTKFVCFGTDIRTETPCTCSTYGTYRNGTCTDYRKYRKYSVRTDSVWRIPTKELLSD